LPVGPSDELLAEKNMTGVDLAKAVDLDEQTISNIRTGRIKQLSLDTLGRLCGALECQPGDLLRYIPEPSDQDWDNSSHP